MLKKPQLALKNSYAGYTACCINASTVSIPYKPTIEDEWMKMNISYYFCLFHLWFVRRFLELEDNNSQFDSISEKCFCYWIAIPMTHWNSYFVQKYYRSQLDGILWISLNMTNYEIFGYPNKGLNCTRLVTKILLALRTHSFNNKIVFWYTGLRETY